MRRYLPILIVALLALPLALALLAFVLHTPIVERATRAGLARVAERLGTEVVVERVEVDGLAGVHLHRLRIGPLAAPLLTVRHFETRLDVDALLDRRVQPTLVELEGVALHLRSDGTTRGLLDAARDALPSGLRDRLEGAADGPATGGGPARRLPDVIVRRARIIDHGGALHVTEGALTLSGGRVEGRARVRTPALDRCTVAGTLETVTVECEEPLGRDLPGGLRVTGRTLELFREPTPAVRLRGVQLAATDTGGGIGAVLGGLSADLRLDLRPDDRGNRALETRLVLPGGGHIAGRGTVHPRRIAVSARVADLHFGRAHESIGGSVTGAYRLEIDVAGRKGYLEGRGQMTGLTAEHPAIADGPVGPFDMLVKGRVDARLLDPETRAVAVEISRGRFEVGGVGFDFEAAVDTTPDAWTVDAALDTGTVDGADLARAIPEGLLPNLQPIEARGRFGMKAKLAIDRTKLDETVLDVDLDIRGLKVTAINDRIDFDALRSVFETRFEMPPEEGEDEGEILVRETGPESERWVPFEQIPPLLPLTVTTQEDGGFYKHGGVSLFHLRGSLIRNLERGRFARGGSTISMQLARNLFLNRRKTLARKLEEVILTWLLEQEFTKDELMTLYLNVVEFGPDIFGIGEAAAHYFQKPPLALTAPEIAWIVRLLPNPRGQYEMFEDKKLTRQMTASINRLLRRLVVREHMAEEDLVQIGPEELFLPPELQPEDAPLPSPGDLRIPPGMAPPGMAPPAPPGQRLRDQDERRIRVRP